MNIFDDIFNIRPKENKNDGNWEIGAGRGAGKMAAVESVKKGTAEDWVKDGRVIDKGLFIIAGPCVIETEDILYETAGTLKEIGAKLGLPIVFKCSYDKANRSSIDSYRGVGIEKGLRMLSNIKDKFNIPIITDVHTPKEAEIAAEVVDILQVPAFLSRQTDLIIAASKTGKTVNIKKGQFLAPWDMKNIINKFTSTGNEKLMLTERGSMFGYNNLVVDFRSIPIMKSFGYPVIYDVTHSIQLPGGLGNASDGQRHLAPYLLRAAVACGADGLFIEVHPNPDKALCDGPNMLCLDDIEYELQIANNLYNTVKLVGKHDFFYQQTV
ncbi:3-deoxy-8-phosphooctulonate synthase [Candidatus Magnetoovum chiemensis]|nr:3-deoxy-8-phosphooctulonate synthase [Candidatus Magnetoovum chiemensis]